MPSAVTNVEQLSPMALQENVADSEVDGWLVVSSTSARHAREWRIAVAQVATVVEIIAVLPIVATVELAAKAISLVSAVAWSLVSLCGISTSPLPNVQDASSVRAEKISLRGACVPDPTEHFQECLDNIACELQQDANVMESSYQCDVCRLWFPSQLVTFLDQCDEPWDSSVLSDARQAQCLQYPLLDEMSLHSGLTLPESEHFFDCIEFALCVCETCRRR